LSADPQKGKKKADNKEFDLQSTSYAHLPFQASDIMQVYPKLKEIEMINTDIKAMVNNGKQAFNDNQLERANDIFS